MFTSLTDFFPKYPSIKKAVDPLFDPYGGEPFGTAVLRRRSSLTLSYLKWNLSQTNLGSCSYTRSIYKGSLLTRPRITSS